MSLPILPFLQRVWKKKTCILLVQIRNQHNRLMFVSLPTTHWDCENIIISS